MRKVIKTSSSSVIPILLVLLTLCLPFYFRNAFAQQSQQAADNPGYDKYTRDLRKGSYTKEKDSFLERAGNMPAVPLELTKKGIEKALIYIEKTHLNDKVQYVWGKIHDWGFHPTGQQLHDRPQVGYNILWDRSKLINASPYVEHAGFTAWNGLNYWGYKEAAGKINLDNIYKTGLYANQEFRYEDRKREDFFGVGHNTSRGDSYTYRLEAMNYQTRWGRLFHLPWNLGRFNVEGEYRFRDVRISGGRNGANHNIRDFFKNDAALAGINGGEYNTIGLNLMHDDRNDVEDPHWGGYRKFTVLWNKGVNGADFDFIKYQIDVAQFFPVFKTGNVIGVRYFGEFNNKEDGGTLPFFEMARLGGWSSLRGFLYNRFFDNNSMFMSFEYRYNVWTFKRFKVDLVPFLDIGSVFGESGDFELSNTRFSYGGAGRFMIRDRVNIDLEIGHSDEGTEFYVKYKAPF